VSRVTALVPLPVLYALLGGVAFVLRLSGWRRELVRDGLARCLADRSGSERADVERGFWQYLGELVAEVLHASGIPAAELERRVRLENPELVAGHLAAGRRVLLLAAHHGNWEWLLLRLSGAFGVPLAAAYKPASRERADRALKAMRERFGATMVPGKELVAHLIAKRGQVRLLALLADQSPAGTAEQQVWTGFFGRDTAFHGGPGWIAARMGYVPVYAAVAREARGQYAVRFLELPPPVDRGGEDLVAAYARTVEAEVRQRPREYFWAYRRWKRSRPVYG